MADLGKIFPQIVRISLQNRNHESSVRDSDFPAVKDPGSLSIVAL